MKNVPLPQCTVLDHTQGGVCRARVVVRREKGTDRGQRKRGDEGGCVCVLAVLER